MQEGFNQKSLQVQVQVIPTQGFSPPNPVLRASLPMRIFMVLAHLLSSPSYLGIHASKWGRGYGLESAIHLSALPNEGGQVTW